MVMRIIGDGKLYLHFGIESLTVVGRKIIAGMKNKFVNARSQQALRRKQVRYAPVGIGNALGDGFPTGSRALKKLNGHILPGPAR